MLLGLLLVLGVTQALGEKTRLAIIAGEATEPVRSLLSAEISQRPDMTVLERAELDKVASEVALQSHGFISADQLRAGQLLHADALLMLLPDPAHRALQVRLVAVAPGAVLFEDSVRWPVPAPAEWAAIAAKKLSPYLASLHASKTPRIPLSILRIHSVTAGWESSRAEGELGFLLSHRLRNEPSLWVLERTQMGPLEWEKALQASPASFWTGSYLLDGTLTAEAGGYTIAARLRSAKLGKDIPLSAHGANLRQLSEALASQVTASLQIDRPGAPWDMAAEARQFQDEALWAWRWKLYEEASQASESAWALGLKNNTVALLRFQSDASRLSAELYATEGRSVIDKPKPWMFDCATETLDRLQESLAWKGPDLPQEWVGLSAGCLWECSRLLRGWYYFAPDLQPVEAEALAALRARLRTLSDSLKPAAEKFPRPLIEEKAIGLAPPPAGAAAPHDSLYTVRGIFGALWQEDALQCASQFRLVLDGLDRLSPDTRMVLKAAILSHDDGFVPWLASWNRTERRISVAAFRATLLNAPVSPERPIDVARMMMEPARHLEPFYDPRIIDVAQIRAAMGEVENALWNARVAFAQGQITPEYYFGVIGELMHEELRASRNGPPPQEVGVEAFRLRLFKYLIAARQDDAPRLERFEPELDKLTPDDMKELTALIHTSLQRHPENPMRSTHLSSMEHTYATGGAQLHATTIPAMPAGQTGQCLPAAWTVSQAQMIGGSSIQNSILRYRQGCLYMLASNLAGTVTHEPNLLFVFNPAKGTTARSVYLGPAFENFDIEIAQGRLLITDGNKVSSYVAGAAGWSEFKIPEMTDPRLFVVDGRVYVTGAPGILVQLDPSTGKSEILVSSRRRPALNNLDDCPAYDISKVFQDATGRLCLLLDYSRVYRQDAANHTWTELFDAQKGQPAIWPEQQVLLAAIGADGFVTRHFGPNPDLALGGFVGCVAIERAKASPPAPPPPGPPGMPKPTARGNRVRATDSAVFDGTDLWLLTTDDMGQRLLLKRMSASGQFDHVIPIEIGNPGGPMLTAQMCAAPDGLFIYRGDKGAFYRKADLAAWHQP
ncbi:MAG: hypothetical protein WDN28_25120 [Chthoniobacter sp.]